VGHSTLSREPLTVQTALCHSRQSDRDRFRARALCCVCVCSSLSHFVACSMGYFPDDGRAMGDDDEEEEGSRPEPARQREGERERERKR